MCYMIIMMKIFEIILIGDSLLVECLKCIWKIVKCVSDKIRDKIWSFRVGGQRILLERKFEVREKNLMMQRFVLQL